MPIKKCLCTSSYQDQKYGYGLRVANLCKDGSYRCTICGQKISKVSNEKKDKK